MNLAKASMQCPAFVFQETDPHAECRHCRVRETAPGNQRIGIAHAADDFLDTGADQRVSAGRRAPVMTARFEGDVERRALRLGAGLFERDDLGVIAAGELDGNRRRRFCRRARAPRRPWDWGWFGPRPFAPSGRPGADSAGLERSKSARPTLLFPSLARVS